MLPYWPLTHNMLALAHQAPLSTSLSPGSIRPVRSKSVVGVWKPLKGTRNWNKSPMCRTRIELSFCLKIQQLITWTPQLSPIVNLFTYFWVLLSVFWFKCLVCYHCVCGFFSTPRLGWSIFLFCEADNPNGFSLSHFALGVYLFIVFACLPFGSHSLVFEMQLSLKLCLVRAARLLWGTIPFYFIGVSGYNAWEEWKIKDIPKATDISKCIYKSKLIPGTKCRRRGLWSDYFLLVRDLRYL